MNSGSPVEFNKDGFILDVDVDAKGKYRVLTKRSIFTSTSIDGGEWIETSLPLSEDMWRGKLAINKYGALVVIGAPNGKVLTSVDGVNWQVVNSNTTSELKDVIANSLGNFVAVGDNGVIIFSEDGQSWRVVSNLNSSKTIFRVSVNSLGEFVAVGSKGNIEVSKNGIDWHVKNPNDIKIGDTSLYGVVSNKSGDFVAVGNDGVVIYSNDAGKTWKKISPLNTIPLLDVISY